MNANTSMETKQDSDNPIQKIANKYGKAKQVAWDAQKRRVSRRLLLAIRAQKLTVCCPISGIVSLLEVPAIPDFAAEYEHPLSSLENARALAQRGIDYLRKLDSQTLAGILIVLAANYDLFRFQESDSGAQKNAILRTAGKDTLIDAIIIIEDQIHSRNVRYLPRLSLTFDTVTNTADNGIDIRLHNYLTLLTEALRKPDTSVYDENAAPKKIGKPLYIRDVQKQERHISYLARQEIASAKRELANDAKAAKTLASNLVANGYSKPGMKPFITQLMADNGMGLVEADVSLIDMLVNQKLVPIVQEHDSEDAKKLIAILRKDRSILKKETSEEEFLDDPTPGNESAIVPTEIEQQEEQEELVEEEQELHKEALDPQPPEGLSFVEKILWKKKLEAAKKSNGHVHVAPEVPSIHKYIPSHPLKKEEN